MASSTRPCTISKCEISSCAVCHCCQNDLCLDHLKEHKDQLNAKLIPLTNQINSFLDTLEHFTPTSLPSFKILEQWRTTAHQTVDRFYERMRDELFEQKKNKPLEKLRATRDSLDQLIRKQGATRENIISLTNDIQSVEQEINGLQNIQINLQPLVIDGNAIIQLKPSTRQQQHNSNEHVQPNWCSQTGQPTAGSNKNQSSIREESSFQIFVQLLNGEHIFITVKPSDTIMQLKQKIQDKNGLPIDQQYLTYVGKMLKDEYSVAIYDIQKQSTIKLNLQMRSQRK